MSEPVLTRVRRGAIPVALLALCLTTTPAARGAAKAYVPSRTSNNVHVIDIGSNALIATVPVGTNPQSSAVTATRAYIANQDGATGNGNVSVIDTSSDTVVATITVGGGLLNSIAVNGAGTRGYVVDSFGSSLKVIDLTLVTPAVIATIPVGAGAFGVALNDALSRAYVANQTPANVTVIDTGSNTVSGTITAGTGAFTVATGGGRAYIVNGGAGNVTVVDIPGNTFVATVTVGSDPRGVAVAPTLARAYVANQGSNNVSVIDTSLAPPAVIATVSVGTQPSGVALSDDLSRLFVTNANWASASASNVTVINTAGNSVVATVTVGVNPQSIGDFVGPGPVPVELQGFSIE